MGTPVEDHELGGVPGHEHRTETIGASSPPYGRAVVEAIDAATGEVAARAETSRANHVRLHGLRPDTDYRYRVHVDGESWGERATYDWVRRDGGTELARTDRDCDLRFRTFPAPTTAHRCGSPSWATTGSVSWPAGTRASVSSGWPLRSTGRCAARGYAWS